MKAPIIMLIILLFVAIFLYGSVLEPYVGDGLYHCRVQSSEGSQWLDTVIKFEPVEGGRQVFTMYNIIFENGEDDSPVETMTRIDLRYSGSYFKHVFGPLYLRPTGLHFPVIDFQGNDRFVLNWEPFEAVTLGNDGKPVEDFEYTTTPHRSTINNTEDGINFDGLPYVKIDKIPEHLAAYIDILEAAEPAVVVDLK